MPSVNACWAVAVLVVFTVTGASAATIAVNSTDVPKVIPDNDPGGITSTLSGPDLVNLTDVNLIFDELLHSSLPDLHLELTSPSGTTTVLVRAASEGGILQGVASPDHFVSTVFDDQAPTNLSAGVAPYTGSFNIDHPSVVAGPLATFNGEDAAGTWTLFLSDLSPLELGVLTRWSIQFTGEPLAVLEPASRLLLVAVMLALLGCHARVRCGRR